MDTLGQPTPVTEERDSSRLIIGLAVFVVIAGALAAAFLLREAPKTAKLASPYIANLKLSDFKMSAAENFIGHTVSYIEGTITNSGDKTVTHAMVEVTFKDDIGQVAQREEVPLQVMRSNGAYPEPVDLSVSPLAPGQAEPFRLTFDSISAQWNRQYPEIRVTDVTVKWLQNAEWKSTDPTIINLQCSTLLRYNDFVPEVKPFRLTESVKAAGWASKLSPAALDTVLGKLARQHDPNVLVGFDHADDAGVYQIAPDQALVQTVDFFTPIVDDPYTFGQIAATNSLSDVYAMGGKPLTSLALVCFPEKADLSILERILAGGLSKMIEAGCTVIGGHSIRDEETKFGYSVTGIVHPKRVLANSGAKVGDSLLLTKSLGTGVISTAIKKGKATTAWIDAAIQSMTTLNKEAADVIRESSFRINAVTDVTGFGLIGHAREMAMASDVSLELKASAIPLLEGALDCVREGYIPGGLKNNRDFAECAVEYEEGVPEDIRTMLFDPQTAGGLLICVAADDALDLSKSLGSKGVRAVKVGSIVTRTKPLIRVTQ